MIRRVRFLSDEEEAPEIDLGLLSEFRDQIVRRILQTGTADAETAPFEGGVGFLTSIPHPFYRRVMARWVMPNDEEALITGLRSALQLFEIPPDAADDEGL